MRFRHLWPLGLVALVQVLLLASPLVRTGYVADDLANSLFHWNAQFLDLNFWSSTWDVQEFWILQQGRLYPLSAIYNNAVFEFVRDRVAYKILLLLFVLASTFTVGLVLVRMGLGARAAALVLLLTTVLFQFRQYNDPIVSFAGLMPIMLLQTALSLWLFQGWLQRGGRGRLAGSIVLYLMAALTYESAYVFTVFHVAVAVVERGGLRSGLRSSVPIIVPTAFMLATAAFLRIRAPAGEDGTYAPNFSPGVLLETTGEQMSGALPLSYALFNLDEGFAPRVDVLLGQLDAAALLAGVVVALAVALLAGTTGLGRGGRRATLQLGLVGLLMWFVAAAPIALAPRYQGELVVGLAHIPVYVEYFGVAMLLFALLRLAFGALADRGAVARGVVAGTLAVVLGVLGALTYRANDVVADRMRPTAEYTALAAALEDDLLRDAAPESIIGPIPGASWQQGAFYLRHDGRRFKIYDVGAPETVPTRQPCRPGRPGTWTVRSGDLGGRFAAASCRALRGPAPAALWLEGDGPRNMLVTALLVPVRENVPPEVHVMPLRLQGAPGGDRRATFTPPRGLDWFTLQMQPIVGPAAVRLTSGCGPAVPGDDGLSHTCRDRARLAVHELGGAARRVELRMAVASATARPATVRLCGRRVRVSARPASLRCRLDLERDEAVPLTLSVSTGAARLINIESVPTPP